MKVKIENSAGGIVYKKQDGRYDWLIISNHRSSSYWGFPKGHIADKISNEKAEEAALREVQEEGGIMAKIIVPTPIKVEYTYKQRETLHKKTVLYFLMEYINGSTDNHDTEVEEALFVSETELMEKLTFQNDRDAFQKAKILLTPHYSG